MTILIPNNYTHPETSELAQRNIARNAIVAGILPLALPPHADPAGSLGVLPLGIGGEGCHLVLKIKYITLQYTTVKNRTVQYSTIQYNKVQYSTVQYSMLQ